MFKFAGHACGCLTQIRSNHHYYSDFGSIVTKRIQEDLRIPLGGSLIKVKDLPAFAEWQREFDALRSRRNGKDIEEG